ncbi:metalloregulator ArsR/SmtB family transcription factor [Saccharothrix violaceirubra]|uniref:Uncharacterized protein YndB with AHSA1/START domain/DNA-binding transcriptional ArsR family regulator n=1 Tax=Saccharothrix violaceirubra TaxID=413306 RepID=A0A7W7T6J3_9PSEU|nr:metalloregulator ArsR/SmtB family transcription factor [Saccharothrix violaceirubra]MBB4966135.1 uncharacterized protein YndB with AHSA1/START domain/DNA-binding transcriptional ArsR family regulator [Saccharothrix violaceirubra]
MERITAALGDEARWRLVVLLADRPRSVGELAELTGSRQPQTTKHLQTLARAGIVSVHPVGRRRVYALEPGPLTELERALATLIAKTRAHQGEVDVITRYHAAIEAETAIAEKGWADGRTFRFERHLDAPVDIVWQYWADADRLASWWVPPSLTVVECVLEPKKGGRAVLEYRDAEGRYRSEGRVHTAKTPKHLAFDLSVLDAAGAVSFTGHYDLALAPERTGTSLHLDLRITDTDTKAAHFIAGITTGWNQVLDNLTRTIDRKKA